MEDNEFYTYIPGYLDGSLFEQLLKEINPLVNFYWGVAYNKVYIAKRLSCLFDEFPHEKSDQKDVLETTSKIQSFNWKSSSLICTIKNKLEEDFDESFDYCLAHLYRDGNDTIAYHRDSEAMETPVVSLSFGATRKFRFREIDKTSGYCKEFLLKSGDLILMKVGCQSVYKHSVPVEKRVKEPRI